MIYVWRSKATANYGPGTIAAMGDTLEKAKDAARDAFRDWIAFNKHWLDLECEEDREELSRLWEDFELDLAHEPKETRAHIINGSE